MPSIHVYMHEGRTVEQKRGLAEDITAAILKNTGAPAEATEVVIHDVPKTNWATAGKLASDAQLPDEKDVVRVLDALGVSYEMVECDPEFADTAAFCEKYGFAPEQSGNTILIASKRGEKKYSACIALAHTRLDVNHSVRDLMGIRRLSFASADETADVTGMMIGGVTPFCLPDDLPVYVDSRIMALDYVILGGGSRSAKVKIDPDVFNKMPTATVVVDLAN